MADEFAKGAGIFTAGGLLWMVLAGWYRTPEFGSTNQLIAPLTVDPASADVLNALAIALIDVVFWFTILGSLTFWVVIPAGRQARRWVSERSG
jgi:hypothetical protein